MLDQTLRGDLRERVDGGFEGWCWAPDRPEQRLVVDLLVNDTVAASIVAAVFRRDLLLRGIGDGRHGFALRLPPNLPETNGEHIVTARERGSGTVFGRVLRGAGAGLPGGERLDGVTEAIDELWRRLETARALRAPPTAADRWRDALGILAGRLAARSATRRPHGDRDAGAPPPSPPILLPELATPELSVVLRAAGAQATLRRLAALAPAADLAAAEFIVVDPGHDPYAAFLPSQVRNLRYLRDPSATTPAAAANLAAPLARGTRLLLLGEAPAEPSAASLLALARAAARAAPALLLGPAASAALAAAGQPPPPDVARLRGRLGVAICIDRALWRDLGPLDTELHDGAGLECADLAFRARLLGRAVLAVAEPAAADPAAVPPAARVAPAAVRKALAAFSERWGAAALDPGRGPA
jgi:hypothetical protein